MVKSMKRKRVDNEETLDVCVGGWGAYTIQQQLSEDSCSELMLKIREELVDRYDYSLSCEKKGKLMPTRTKEEEENKTKLQRLIQRRILCGVNQTTRELQRSSPLLVLVARDLKPATAVSHIPPMAKQANVPLLVVSSSTLLGRCFNTKRISVLCFSSSSASVDAEAEADDKLDTDVDDTIDSFVNNVLKTFAFN
ncbi:hypothetical protein ScalyP_jg7375 [Parmales sp. scaly parma]|jgi:ribosomal protein L7Ae-like RNA K-turn-binding protein|nr:hypothetical protein ScalyP_jg7375 [Parmales sp. scaly parma]|tara:strand:+ start:33 stop:617 length:585 start_codon:yes stop_codon:yes gene_type:complete